LSSLIHAENFVHAATIIRVVDGDTVWLHVDLGFRCCIDIDIRMLGINAPEMHGATSAAGHAAAAFLSTLLPVGLPVILESAGNDKYGRWLGKIYLNDGTDVNNTMVITGHAVVYNP